MWLAAVRQHHDNNSIGDDLWQFLAGCQHIEGYLTRNPTAHTPPSQAAQSAQRQATLWETFKTQANINLTPRQSTTDMTYVPPPTGPRGGGPRRPVQTPSGGNCTLQCINTGGTLTQVQHIVTTTTDMTLAVETQANESTIRATTSALREQNIDSPWGPLRKNGPHQVTREGSHCS